MAVAKQNGDVIPFVKQKDYIMVNNDLGGVHSERRYYSKTRL